MFKTYKPWHPQGVVFLGDGGTKSIEGIGFITILLSFGITIDIHNVLNVPKLGKILISFGQMTSSKVKKIKLLVYPNQSKTYPYMKVA